MKSEINKKTESAWWWIINHEYSILESELEDYAVHGKDNAYRIYERAVIIKAKEEILCDYGQEIEFWDWLYDYAVNAQKTNEYKAFEKIKSAWLLAWVTGNSKTAPEFVEALKRVRDGIKELLKYQPFDFVKEAYSVWRVINHEE